MDDEGQVLHASYEGVHVLRFIGDIRYPMSPALERFVDQLFSATTPVGMVIDLTQTTHIDSTNLGVLARVAKLMGARHPEPVTIVCNREDICEVLVSVGFDEVFRLISESQPNVPAGESVTLTASEPADLARTVLDAHRLLMDLNERNRALFEDVVAALEREAPPEG